MSPILKSRKVIIPVVLSMFLGAFGWTLKTLYANVQTELANKASKESVIQMREDIKYIRDGVDELRRMHIKP